MVVEQLSTQLRRALDGVGEVANRLAHHYVGTEHLLVAVTAGDDYGARRLLHHAGVDPDRLEPEIEQLLGRGRHALTVPPPRTASAEVAVSRSRWEARAVGSPIVSTVHLLLAVLHQADSTAVTVLRAMGADPAAIETVLHADPSPFVTDGLPPHGPGTSRSGPVDGDTHGGVTAGPGDAVVTTPALASPALAAPAGPPGPLLLPEPGEPLAVQVVRLAAEVARLQAEVARLGDRVAGLGGAPPERAAGSAEPVDDEEPGPEVAGHRPSGG